MKRLNIIANKLIRKAESKEDFLEKLKNNFNEDQINEIKKGLEDGLNMDQVLTYTNHILDKEQMKAIRESLENGTFDVDIAEFISNSNIDVGQIHTISSAIKRGLTNEEAKIMAQPIFDYEQLEEIEQGFIDGLNINQVKLYAKPYFGSEEMTEIREGFNDGLSMEEIKTYANPTLSSEEMAEMRKNLEK